MTNKYLRTIYGVDKEGNAGSLQVDVYDILDAYPTRNPALDHLIKKALCPGQRGHKDLRADLDDIIASAQRAKQMTLNKMSCMTEVVLEDVPVLTPELEKALKEGGAKVRFEPGGPTTARPTSFTDLSTIYAFSNVIGGRNVEKLEAAAEGVCEVLRTAHILNTPVGAAVIGSFREGEKIFEGRHLFNTKDALEILSADKLQQDTLAGTTP